MPHFEKKDALIKAPGLDSSCGAPCVGSLRRRYAGGALAVARAADGVNLLVGLGHHVFG